MKNKKSTLSLELRFKKIWKPLFGHRRMILFVLSTGILIYAVLSLNLILSAPSDEDYRTQKLTSSKSTVFDKTTIDRINKLNDESHVDTGVLPNQARMSPFSE